MKQELARHQAATGHVPAVGSRRPSATAEILIRMWSSAMPT